LLLLLLFAWGGQSLIDENIAYLYNRLGDPALAVRKNTLMVLTHLTLNGMVRALRGAMAVRGYLRQRGEGGGGGGGGPARVVG
jgi:hypothetical protein